MVKAQLEISGARWISPCTCQGTETLENTAFFFLHVFPWITGNLALFLVLVLKI